MGSWKPLTVSLSEIENDTRKNSMRRSPSDLEKGSANYDRRSHFNSRERPQVTENKWMDSRSQWQSQESHVDSQLHPYQNGNPRNGFWDNFYEEDHKKQNHNGHTTWNQYQNGHPNWAYKNNSKFEDRPLLAVPKTNRVKRTFPPPPSGPKPGPKVLPSYFRSSSESEQAPITKETIKEEMNEFRRWLSVKLWRISCEEKTLDIAQLRDLFLKECGKPLNYKAWGFEKVSLLLSSMDDIVVIDEYAPKAYNLWPATILIHDVAEIVSDALKENPKGFDMGLLKELFFRKKGYELDHSSLGFPTLKSFVTCLTEVCKVASTGTARIVKP